MKKALICIDFINEIIHSDGKLSGKGYLDFAQQHNSISNIQKLISQYRGESNEVIHVRVCFNEDYSNQPKNSPLLGKAHEFGILQENAWSTEFLKELQPEANEKIITKRRVSAFYDTELHEYLRSQNITDITIVGVATDIAVESAVRDAHDRDYNITVVSDCCIAGNMEDQEKSLNLMNKIAKVI